MRLAMFTAVTSAGAYSVNASGAPIVRFTLPAGTGPGTYAVSYTATVNAQATGSVSNVVVGSGNDTPTCTTACGTNTTVENPVVTYAKSTSATQVKVGDTVVVTYYEAIAAEMRPPTDEEKANPATVVVAAERAAPGEKPGAVGRQSVRLVGAVTSIDMATLRATIKDADGVVHTVQGRDPNNVKRFKVGDPVVLTYTEAVAISVEPAPASTAPRKSTR